MKAITEPSDKSEFGARIPKMASVFRSGLI